jgi:hypothetical protein
VLYGCDNLYAAKEQKNDIIFLGSSHCYYEFDPQVFKDSLGLKAVNLGIEGQIALPIHITRLKYYLAYNPPPKLALLSFDPIISADIPDDQKFTHKDIYARYAFFPNDQDKMFLDYYNYSFIEKYVPLYSLLKYQVLIKCISPYRMTNWEKYGFEPQTANWDTVAFPSSRYKSWVSGYYTNFKEKYESIKRDLKTLDSICKQHGTKLVCVQMPLYKSLYDRHAFDLVTQMCDELNILSLNTNTGTVNDELKNFGDPSHINATGVGAAMNAIIKDPKFIEAEKK